MTARTQADVLLAFKCAKWNGTIAAGILGVSRQRAHQLLDEHGLRDLYNQSEHPMKHAIPQRNCFACGNLLDKSTRGGACRRPGCLSLGNGPTSPTYRLLTALMMNGGTMTAHDAVVIVRGNTKAGTYGWVKDGPVTRGWVTATGKPPYLVWAITKEGLQVLLKAHRWYEKRA